MPDEERERPAQTLTFCPAKNVRVCDKAKEIINKKTCKKVKHFDDHARSTRDALAFLLPKPSLWLVGQQQENALLKRDFRLIFRSRCLGSPFRLPSFARKE